MQDPLDFARTLTTLGVPVFVAPPDASQATGFRLPVGWQQTKADPATLDGWRPGCALAAVCGHGLDVIDVDPRNGGDVAAKQLKADGLWPIEYAIVATPSGGTHHYVAALGIGKTKRDGIDLQAGAPDGTGRGFVFLPGTRRAGKDGIVRPYVVAVNRLDQFAEVIDDDSGLGFLAWIQARPRAVEQVGGTVTLEAVDPLLEIGTKIPVGSHQDVLFRYACSLRARGVREAEAEQLVELRARQDCVPAWAGPSSAWVAVKHAYKYEEGGTTAVEPPSCLQAVQRPGRRLVVRSAAEIGMEVSDWLWRHDMGPERDRWRRYQHWIPLGGLTLLGGREGVGKSSWTARLCAQVTNGEMEGIYTGKPKGVVIAATEDDWANTIVPRLKVAKADLSRVYQIEVAEADNILTGLSLPADISALRDVVLERDVALVVLDPLLAAVDGRLDTHKDADVRRALEPLVRLAQDTNSSLLGLIHMNKAAQGDFLTRLMASRAIPAMARAVLGCAEDGNPPLPDGEIDLMNGIRRPRQFIFSQEKNNLAARVDLGVRYEIVGADAGLARDGREVWTSKIKVVEYKDEKTVSAVMEESEKSKGGGDNNGSQYAQDALRAWLSTQPGRRALKRDAVAALVANGFRGSVVTIERASKALGVEVQGATHNTYWHLGDSPC